MPTLKKAKPAGHFCRAGQPVFASSLYTVSQYIRGERLKLFEVR
jgi:hypothetical protein